MISNLSNIILNLLLGGQKSLCKRWMGKFDGYCQVAFVYYFFKANLLKNIIKSAVERGH